MSYTKRNTIICDTCGLFCKPFDEHTPFGCVDPSLPEPLEPNHCCKKCFKKVKDEWLQRFKHGCKAGDWQKSRAEQEASVECGLVWVGSSGVGMIGTENFAEAHQYISKESHKKLSKLPYWGYCKLCGAERKGGYCSKEKCANSFENKNK